MESALNLAIDDSGVLDAGLHSHGLSAARLAALRPHLECAHAEIMRDLEVGVLGFMTLSHQIQDNPAEMQRLRRRQPRAARTVPCRLPASFA
jgi:hypothetical protein